MSEELIINRFTEDDIESKIFTIRGKQVMLDSDLAILYQCANGTKTINQGVKRNIEKFPERYSWTLTDEENYLVPNWDQKEKRGGKYKNPRVFTEQGVAMLSTIIHTPIAVEISIAIIDAFVAMKETINKNRLLQNEIDIIKLNQGEMKKQLLENKEKIDKLFDKFSEKKIVNQIYFNGRIYDAYSKIVDIFRLAKEELIIIDAYADKTVLDMITDIKCQVVLITKKNNLLKEIDIQKYKKQYNNLSIKYDNTYHDRYFIIDKREVYHCGTSINYAGNKTFSINILEDEIVKKELINHAQI